MLPGVRFSTTRLRRSPCRSYVDDMHRNDFPPFDAYALAHELQLTAGAADVAMTVRLAGSLALQVHLRRVVDRRQSGRSG